MLAAPRAPPRAPLLWLATLLALRVAQLTAALRNNEAPAGFMTYDEVRGAPYNVTYDGRSFMLNGKRTLLLSGAVHYPRTTPDAWPQIVGHAKALGLNGIETYAFWNLHEREEGQLTWEGGANLTAFVQICADAGLFVIVRIGPYVCAEFANGGLPTWLGFKEGIRFREYNAPWTDGARGWFRAVIEQLRAQMPQAGGPVILTQTENELYGASDEYVRWAGDMAAEELARAGVDIPVIMCNGQSADNTVNTCNALDCTSFLESNGQNGKVLITQPPAWTEVELGYQVWSGSPAQPLSYFYGRAPEDVAYSLARWFARGGALTNLYMFFGGSNFGRTASNAMTTAYSMDAPLCPDGLPHEPLFTHLTRLHGVLRERAGALLAAPAQLRNGKRLQWLDVAADTWRSDDAALSAFAYGTTAFLENAGDDVRLVRWRGAEHELSPRSVVIADTESGELLFDSAALPYVPQRRVLAPAEGFAPLHWESWAEPQLPADTAALPSTRRKTPAEQTSITMETTDHLYYETIVSLDDVSLDASDALLLRVTASSSVSLLAWLNGTLATVQPAENHDKDASRRTVEHVLDLSAAAGACDASGRCPLTILSSTIGAEPNWPVDPNSTRFLRGIVGDVMLGSRNITAHGWRMRPGLAGEAQLASGGRIPWAPVGDRTQWPPVTWLRTRFPTPSPLPPAAACLLNLTGLGRGRALVNGQDIGQYWLVAKNDGTGPSQRMYHVPAAWLAAPGELNELVVADVEGVRDVSLVGVAVSRMAPGPLMLTQARTVQACKF